MRSASRRATNLGLVALFGAVGLGVWLLRSAAWFEGPAIPSAVPLELEPMGTEAAADDPTPATLHRGPSGTLQAPTETTAEDEVQAPVQRTRQAGDWAVRGFVIDQDGEPVSQATVGLIRGAKRLERAVDERGAFTFAELAPGSYKLEVDPRSLPEGMLPPWRQHKSLPYSGTATGVHGTTVQLRNEEGVDVDLRTFVGGTIKGRLLGHEGYVIPGSVVAIRGTNGIESGTRTNAEGLFEIAGAYPGPYRTFVTLNEHVVTRNTGPPETIEFVLEPGGVHDLGDLVTRGR